MSISDEQHQDVAEDTPDLEIPIAELVAAVWQRRRWLAKVTGLGMLLAAGIAFMIPYKYISTAQLMPPDAQSLSSTSALSILTGASSVVPSLTGGLMSQRTPSGTYIGVMYSQTAQDDIINRFDLRRVYHCKLYITARKTLTKRTTIIEDKKSGIVSIAVMDNDRYRARDLAEAYIEELDKLVNKGSNSAARRERIFLEERLKSIKSDLDASILELSKFSSRNATLDIYRQGEATVEAAARLQGQITVAQSELSGLKAMYTDDNVKVRQLRGRIDELQRQLRKMGGVGEDVDGASLKSDQLFPSIRKLPLLGVTYYDLYRQVTMQGAIYEILTKQYELAKVQEAREIPPIKVLDEPDVPEKKSSPHEMMIVFYGIVLSALAGIAWIISPILWNCIRDFYSAKTA